MLKKDKNVVKEIKIDTEDCIKLERTFYELKSFQDTLSYLLDAHIDDDDYINSNQFKSFSSKSSELFKGYDEFKNYITIKYVPQEFLDTKDVKYT